MLRWTNAFARGAFAATLMISVIGRGTYGFAQDHPIDEPTNGGETPESMATEPTNAAEFPPLPDILLAPPPPEFVDEAAYRRSIRTRTDALAAQAATATDPLVRTEHLLAAANLTLSFELEPYATWAFLRLPGTPQPKADDDPPALLAQALRRIEQAHLDLRVSESGEPANKGHSSTEDQDLAAGQSQRDQQRFRLTQRADALRAFANALSVYLALEKETVPDHDQVREAASNLAPLLEDEDSTVAWAALIWQSLLRSREADPDAVVSRLDFVSVEPSRGGEPYAFLGRLLRCRVLGDRRSRPLAIGLLLQLEERCFDWFDDPPKREAALRTVALMRYQVLRDWYDSLDAATADDERQWCAAQARKILADSFQGSPTTVLRLSPAIPILVPAPAGPSRPDAPPPSGP